MIQLYDSDRTFTNIIMKNFECKEQCAEKGTLRFLLCDHKGAQAMHEKGKEK